MFRPRPARPAGAVSSCDDAGGQVQGVSGCSRIRQALASLVPPGAGLPRARRSSRRDGGAAGSSRPLEPAVQEAIAAGLFAVVLGLVVTERIHRTKVALAGAAVAVLAGLISQEEAIEAIDWGVIGLLAGMMVLVWGTERTGVFTYLAIRVGQASRGRPARLMFGLTGDHRGRLGLPRQRDHDPAGRPDHVRDRRRPRARPDPADRRRGDREQPGRRRDADRRPAQHHHRRPERPRLQRLPRPRRPPRARLLPGGHRRPLPRLPARADAGARSGSRSWASSTRRRASGRGARWRSCSACLGATIVGFFVHSALGLEPATIALSGAALYLLHQRRRRRASARWRSNGPPSSSSSGLFVVVGALEVNGVLERITDWLADATGGSRHDPGARHPLGLGDRQRDRGQHPLHGGDGSRGRSARRRRRQLVGPVDRGLLRRQLHARGRQRQPRGRRRAAQRRPRAVVHALPEGRRSRHNGLDGRGDPLDPAVEV